jgi:hypothetical protein
MEPLVFDGNLHPRLATAGRGRLTTVWFASILNTRSRRKKRSPSPKNPGMSQPSTLSTHTLAISRTPNSCLAGLDEGAAEWCPLLSGYDEKGENAVIEPKPVTKERLIGRLSELAATPPEDTRGGLGSQVKACKMMYDLSAQAPALCRLNEIQNLDPARTKGLRQGQEAAAKLLKSIVRSIRVDKTGVQ